MRPLMILLALVLHCQACFGGSLPVITMQPGSQTVTPGSNATFYVAATGATAYQWRFNGTNISGATGSSFQIASAQLTDVGYYMVVVKNGDGWVPSRLAFLSVVGVRGIVPLSNQSPGPVISQAYANDPYGGGPITNGNAYVVAGPALDQMKPVGASTPVAYGYFDGAYRSVPSVVPGQAVYYRMDLTYPYWGGTFTQHSTVLQLTAGGGGFPVPSTANIHFPVWPEWPEPWYYPQYSSPTNPVVSPGSSIILSNECSAYADYGIPTLQWRKDGRTVTAPMSFLGGPDIYGSSTDVLMLTNLQPEDAGTYDAVIIGNNWLISPQIALSIQFTNGPGILRWPRITNRTNFICDLEGVATLNYGIQSSTNLVYWTDLFTLSNATGTVTFSNAVLSGAQQCFRAMLLQ